MDKVVENTFNQLKEDVEELVMLKLELFKLNAYERFSHLIASFARVLLLVLTGISILLFGFIALAIFLGRVLGDPAWGFLAVTGIYLLFGVLLLVFGKSFKLLIANSVLGAFMEQDTTLQQDDEEDEAIG